MPATTKNKMSMSVVILTYKNPAFLDCTLSSLHNTLGPNDEVIITEDAEDGRTSEIACQHQQCLPITHLTQPDTGRNLCLARNRGIAASQGDLILLLDHDIIFPAGALARIRDEIQPGWALGLRRVMISEEETARIIKDGVPRTRGEWNKLKLAAVLRKWEGRRYLLPMRRSNAARGKSQNWKSLASFGVLVFKEDLIAANGFDCRFDGVPFAEDWDLFARLSSLGVRFALGSRLCTVFHLEHGRPNDNPDSRNYHYLRDTITTRRTRAIRGLSELQFSESHLKPDGGGGEGMNAGGNTV